MITVILDWILHIDAHLSALAMAYGTWIYVILFMVIFVETGLIVMPFLPGDSLLFVAGALAAKGIMSLPELMIILTIAAVLGDAVNFAIGSYIRRNAIDTRKFSFIKQEYLDKTTAFFQKHGNKTIVLARFVPIVRTFAPFCAALGNMPYRQFVIYNLLGGVIWIVSLTGAGALFGNIPWIRDNLTLVVLGIVFLSILPGIVSWISNLPKNKQI